MKTKLPSRWELISEKAFTAQVIQLAQRLGWKVAHFRPAMTAKGWRTAVQGDGVGFPDLVLVHRKKCRLIFAELKRETGEPSPEQHEWLDDLTAVQDRLNNFAASFKPDAMKPGDYTLWIMHVAVWRPSDIDEIEGLLK